MKRKSNPSSEAPEPANRMVQSGMVKVRVTGQPIGEEGSHYVKGAVFEMTPERAAALGKLVEPIE